MAHYEIEVKTLLGPEERAAELREKMCTLDPGTSCVAKNKQLNHYFKDGDVSVLYEKVHHLFSEAEQEKLKKIINKGEQFSVRTRQKDNQVLLVVKASLDEGSSENTVSRLEFEESVEIPLPELDNLVQSAGFTYQAKWSREREEYLYKGANVCIDRNAGYGFLAEFEKVTEDESLLGQIREDIDALMAELGLEELPQDRLERMFAHYNENWPKYYGTEKTFVIE